MADPVPGTLGYMKARIVSELGGRSNLTDAIADAINDAISIYAEQRFRFSDTIPSAPPQFNTVAGQWIYTSAAEANISTLFKIDTVLVLIGNMWQELKRREPVWIRTYNDQGTMTGQPSEYAYEGNSLLLAPIPSQVYTVQLNIFRNVPAPATDDEADNPWMTDGEMLIRSRAKYEIAIHKTRNTAMARLMSPDPPEDNGGVVGAAYSAWKSLKRAGNRVTSLGRVRPMAF